MTRDGRRLVGAGLWRREGARGFGVRAGAVDPVTVTGVSGFTATGTGSYYGLSDNTQLQAAATMTTACMFRVDSLVAATRRLWSKGNGNPGWSYAISSAGVLSYRESSANFLGLYQLTADDVGKTFVLVLTRSNATGAYLYAYRVGDESIVILGHDTSVTAPNTTTESAAIGARRGDSTGGEEASGCTIIGCAYGDEYIDAAAARSYIKACVAAGKVLTTLPGAVSVYQAPDLGTDLVGSNDMTKVENTEGDLAATDPFVPEYRDAGRFRVVPWLGQSNARGSAALADVPDYSGTGGIDYSANYADANIYNFVVVAARVWDDLRPLGDDQWAGELSFGRAAITNGEAAPLHILKHAAGGSSVADEWNVNDPDNLGSSITNFEAVWNTAFELTTGADRSFNPFALPEIAAVVWIQGEADGTNEVDSLAYATNCGNLIDRFLDGRYRIAADFKWIDFKLPAFQTMTYKANVNACKDALAAARPYVVQVNTDAGTDEGDDLHYDPGSLIQTGIAAEAAWRTGVDQVMGAAL